MQDLDFNNAATLINILKRAMRCVGTWPETNFINEIVLTVTITYLSLHCTLMFIDLGRNITDITLVVSCGMEGGFIFLALLKIIICRINRKTLAIFIEDIRGDFFKENYQTTEEKMAFLSYNNFSRKFTKVSLVSAFAASGSYFFMTLASNIEMVVSNSSYGFQLPYRVLNLIEPTNVATYACLCSYQFFVVICLVFGYIGTDCFFVSLVLHVSGLFSALSCRVKHDLDDPRDRQLRLKKLIIRHIRLIRLSECLEDDFNMIILIQLSGSTFQFCLVGYDALVNSGSDDTGMLIAFFLIVVCVFFVLLTYCYTGELLIKESSLLGDCLYHCEWYNMSKVEKKLMHICMMRSTKHMRLTSGKFCILSLNTFSEVLKTSMAYFSVLRTFL